MHARAAKEGLGAGLDVVGEEPLDAGHQVEVVPAGGFRVRGPIGWVAAEQRGDAGEALGGDEAHVERRQAPTGIAAMGRKVLLRQRLEQFPPPRRQGVLFDQQVGHRSPRRSGPDAEGGDELGLVDHPVLQRQQAEEQVAQGVIMCRHSLGSRPRRAMMRSCPAAHATSGSPRAYEQDKRVDGPRGSDVGVTCIPRAPHACRAPSPGDPVRVAAQKARRGTVTADRRFLSVSYRKADFQPPHPPSRFVCLLRPRWASWTIVAPRSG